MYDEGKPAKDRERNSLFYNELDSLGLVPRFYHHTLWITTKKTIYIGLAPVRMDISREVHRGSSCPMDPSPALPQGYASKREYGPGMYKEDTP